VLSVAFLVHGSWSAHAGAFTQKAGRGQIIITGTEVGGSHFFDRRGDLVRVPRYRKFEPTALIEYGVTDWLTAIVKPSLLYVRTGPPNNDDYAGLGSTELGGRLRLYGGDQTPVSIQGTVRLPGPRDAQAPAEIGNTNAEFDLRLLVGAGFQIGGWNSFVDAQAGYRYRSGGPPNEYRLDLTFGTRPTDKLLLLAQSFSLVSDGAGRGIFRFTRSHKLQVSAVYELAPNWAVQVGAITTVEGRSALRERGVIVGLWRQF
jgi:hypothetical protein